MRAATRRRSRIWPVLSSRLFLVGLSVFVPGLVLAQSPDWISYGPEGNAGVLSIVIDPRVPTTVYGLSTGDIVKSVDGGVTWTRARRGVTGSNVWALVADPREGAILYASTDRGVFKSTDGAATWQLAKNNGLPSSDVRSIAIDPLTPSTLYAATSRRTASYGGVFMSRDAGDTWVTLTDVGANLLWSQTALRGLTVDPLTPTTIYLRLESGTYKRTAESTWSRIDWSTGVLSGLAIDPRIPSTIYAANQQGGVFKTVDGGATWVATPTAPPARIWTLLVHPLVADTVFAGTSSNGLYVTRDGGQTWTPLSSGLGENAGILELALDRLTATTLYAGVRTPDGDRLFTSTDGGLVWRVLPGTGFTGTPISSLAIDPITPTTIYAGVYDAGVAVSDAGVAKSTDGGMHWTRILNRKTVSEIAIDPLTPSTVYASGPAFGLVKSVDGGGTWTANQPGLEHLVIDPLMPTTLYANNAGRVNNPTGVLKSTDGGSSWYAINNGLPLYFTVSGLSIDPLTPTTLYASLSKGLAKSTDGGATWTQQFDLGTGPTVFYAGPVAIAPSLPTTLYAAAANDSPVKGVFRSVDGGRTWALASTLWASLWRVDPVTPTTLYGKLGDSLLESTDGAASWHPMNPDFPYAPWDLAVDPLTPTTVYAATGSGGVFILRDAPAGSRVQLPLSGGAAAVPGRISAAAYDRGGQGRGYYDTTPGNEQGGFVYRTDDVDIKRSSEGGYAIGWMTAGEWLAYTIDAPRDGAYTVAARVGSALPGRTFHLAVDGTDVSGPIAVPDLGAWDTYGTATRRISLSAGRHVLRVVMGPADFMEFQSLEITEGGASEIRGGGDFDGDGRADLMVFRPASGGWYVNNGSSSVGTFGWGLPGDVPLAGDFDGDGRSDLTVWRPANGTWYLRESSSSYSEAGARVIQWGLPGDVPISGDFDGDGRSELTVFRPSTGTWHVRYSSQAYSVDAATAVQWGLPGDVPVVADFDGDGRSDLTAFRPSVGIWYVRESSRGYAVAEATAMQWGLPGDVPISRDFDGDGRTELTVYRPATGQWFVRYSTLDYDPARAAVYQWGLPGDIPVP